MIFDNGIAAIPSIHTCCPGGCSKCECAQGKPNDEKKNLAIMAMPLSKMGGKKIVVAKIICEELKKKKSATSTIFLQHFHNKSQVISYY